MIETEHYTKVHNFLYDSLHLPEVPLQVFAYLFSIFISGDTAIWGTAFLAKGTHLSTRSVKQAVKCLVGIGAIRKTGVASKGSNMFVPNIGKCETTTQAKEQLVNAIHQCSVFTTGAPDSPDRCTRCTYGGAYRSPQLKEDNIIIKTINYGTRNFQSSEREPAQEFTGSDTL